MGRIGIVEVILILGTSIVPVLIGVFMIGYAMGKKKGSANAWKSIPKKQE